MEGRSRSRRRLIRAAVDDSVFCGNGLTDYIDWMCSVYRRVEGKPRCCYYIDLLSFLGDPVLEFRLPYLVTQWMSFSSNSSNDGGVGRLRRVSDYYGEKGQRVARSSQYIRHGCSGASTLVVAAHLLPISFWGERRLAYVWLSWRKEM